MNSEKPYKPSIKEILKAEKSMTFEQIEASHARVENLETPQLEWYPKIMAGYLHEGQVISDELNASLQEGEKLWRLPTALEMISAIKNKEIDNSRDNKVRWCWTSSRVDDEDVNLLTGNVEWAAHMIEKSKKEKLPEELLYYVVNEEGYAETAVLLRYGIRLVRDKE